MAHMKARWRRASQDCKKLGTGLTQFSLQMDVTDKESIRNTVKSVEEAEGVLHILVNKCVHL